MSCHEEEPREGSDRFVKARPGQEDWTMEYKHYRCGDGCRASPGDTDWLWIRPCECGGEEVDVVDQWCCMSPDDNCTTNFTSARQSENDPDDYLAPMTCH